MKEFKNWNDGDKTEDVAYYWGNSSFKLGVGRCAPKKANNRVNDRTDFDSLKSKKDGGKTFYALFAAKMTNEAPKLNWTVDNTPKSGNSSELEYELKKELVGNKFISINNQFLTKIQFAESIVVPKVIEVFGEGIHAMIARLASKDGDLWGRFNGDPTALQAFKDIYEKLLN